MSDTVVEARNLSKVFPRRLLSSGPRRIVAFEDVSIAIPRGSVYGLVGESGCGKSSLARVLVGIDRATKGSVLLEGRELWGLGSKERKTAARRHQMVYQDPNGSLDPRHRIGTSLHEALIAAGVKRAEHKKEVARLLGLVRLDPDLAERRPHELSGGQRQRVVIARALATSPSFMALDEPVSSLDVSVQASIIDLLMNLRSMMELTYLLISHDLALVAAICDRISVMKSGSIVETGKGRAVIESASHEYTRELRDRSLVMGGNRRRIHGTA